MCKIDLNTIVKAIVQRKTIPEEQIKLLLPKYIASSTKNTQPQTNTNPNFLKIQKKFHIVSLKCPLSRQPIKVPARSKKCTHLQCFDLGNFLLHSENTQMWRCPICRQQAKLEDLLIDGYLKSAIEQNRHLSGEGKFQIFCDGKYNVINSNPQKTKLVLQQNSTFQKRGNNMNTNEYESKNVSVSVNMNLNRNMGMTMNTNMSNNESCNGRKRDLLKILQAEKDLTTSNFTGIQQQRKKKSKIRDQAKPTKSNSVNNCCFKKTLKL